MNREAPKPIFGFLWNRASSEPLDADARQAKWLRITPRGPWRLALLIGASLTLLSLVPPALVALVAAPSAYALAVIAVIAVPAIALLARGWVAGCYANDTGIKVATVLRTTYAPWSSVSDVRTIEGRCRWLGTPIPIRGARVVIVTDAGQLESGVCTASPDAWLRPEAWAIARDRLDTWWPGRPAQRPLSGSSESGT